MSRYSSSDLWPMWLCLSMEQLLSARLQCRVSAEHLCTMQPQSHISGACAWPVAARQALLATQATGSWGAVVLYSGVEQNVAATGVRRTSRFAADVSGTRSSTAET